MKFSPWFRSAGFVLTALIVSAQDGAPYPAFDQFRVTRIFSGKPAPPVLRTASDRLFRTRIREGAADGPNFAGHYTIADWGCGAGCVSIAVIDAVDGRIYPPPFHVLSWELLRYEGKILSNDDAFEQLSYRKDSRLLIARGCPEEKNCGTYFYEWSAQGASSGFKLLRKVAAAPAP